MNVSENPLRTRGDVAEWLESLSGPLPARATPGKAGLKLGATQSTHGEGLLEGFARPLWGWVPGAQGGAVELPWAQWREGLAHGTDPEHPEFWGWPVDRDPCLVEMPAIALGLAGIPDLFWKPLPAEAKDRVVAWLSRINQVEVVDNNWIFFRVLVNVALRSLGEPWSTGRLQADLRRIDEFYLGDGWYSDGKGRHGDYYIPMGMHFYGLMYCALAGKEDEARAKEWRERAARFAQDFQHWFAADGAALPFGRSLTYRFAQGAFWGALAFADVEALPWGVVKGLYLRHLRWWMRQPILTDGGLLSIGYQYPNLIMTEDYISPASPYWAFKAFLPLALPETHPFWQSQEAPLPELPELLSVPGAGFVVTREEESRHVVALNAGQAVNGWPRHDGQKYSKFAYSTAFAFSIGCGTWLSEGGFDSTLALSEDGEHFRSRGCCLEATVQGPVAYSLWKPWPDVEVRTWLIAVPHGHVRMHGLTTSRSLWSAETGFSVPFPASRGGQGKAVVCEGQGGGSGVLDLKQLRSGELVKQGPNLNLAFPRTIMPVLRSEHSPGQYWLAAFAGGWLQNGAGFLKTGDLLVCEQESDGVRVLLDGRLVFAARNAPSS